MYYRENGRPVANQDSEGSIKQPKEDVKHDDYSKPDILYMLIGLTIGAILIYGFYLIYQSKRRSTDVQNYYGY